MHARRIGGIDGFLEDLRGTLAGERSEDVMDCALLTILDESFTTSISKLAMLLLLGVLAGV